MMTLSFNPQEFYSTQGQITDPGPYSADWAQFPDDLSALIDTIQGLMVHLHWSERYGLFLDKAHKEEANIRNDREFLMMRSAFIAHQQDLLPEYFFQPKPHKWRNECRKKPILNG